jgi:hypothetical protein
VVTFLGGLQTFPKGNVTNVVLWHISSATKQKLQLFEWKMDNISCISETLCRNFLGFA